MEMNAPNTGGADEQLLPYLERLWGLPAKAPAHDPQRNGWLTCVCVLGLVACGSALGAIASASVAPLLLAATLSLASATVVLLHRHSRKRRIARWH
jgi:hypothetical protein